MKNKNKKLQEGKRSLAFKRRPSVAKMAFLRVVKTILDIAYTTCKIALVLVLVRMALRYK